MSGAGLRRATFVTDGSVIYAATNEIMKELIGRTMGL